MNNSNLAQRIKELRNRKGITQELLAEESGLSLRTIQRIENNETIPRGDSLKRLAIALQTSPDEIIDWQIQEDKNYLTLMSISALGFLFFPLLGIIIPLTMWILKKDKIKNVNALGKSLLNFQITWALLFFLYYIFFFAIRFGWIFNDFFTQIDMPFLIGSFLIYLPLLLLYAYNIIMVVYNTIRIYRGKQFKYTPALRILR